MPKQLTMQDIANAAGVSVTTVSHTLSGKKPVKAQTAARIRRVIADLGYVPDAAGQRLRLGKSHMLGLAVPDLSNRFFARLAQGVEQAADQLDYGVVIGSTAVSDPRREARYFNMLRTHLIDGLIYTAGREPVNDSEFASIADKFPVVLADERLDAFNIPTVTSDNLLGGRIAAKALADLGHTRVIMLAGVPGLASTHDRIEGAHEFFPNILVLHGDFEIESGYRLMGDVLANEIAFTAVLCGNDRMAIGAIQRLQEAGMNIPQDISVIGFDDIELASLVRPRLTTIRQQPELMGAQAAKLLIKRIEDETLDESTSPVVQTLPVELVLRETTKLVSHR